MDWFSIVRAAAFPAALTAFAAYAAESPAPPLRFEAGTVLAGGHILAEAVLLPPVPGMVTLAVRDGAPLHWRIAVAGGETRLLLPDGRWAAKAEYSRVKRDGQMVCLIYQTYLSPRWLVDGVEKRDHADFTPLDDRIYAFREAPCP
ncbi:MAG TPA: hypothetical protein VF194_04680 [Ferrovibrio sp.]|jgi:hypothetical protein|uniref:hypothetical protein n=1 Tax=Ferrovibrio sp. TaxID=1917215 RepID=UPI002ED2E56D